MQAHLSTAQETFLPCIVVGELCYGAHRSARARQNLKRIREFASMTTVLQCDTETALVYGAIKYQLRSAGTPLPENDIWISALAQQHGLILVTRDAHFDLVGDLQHERW